MGRPAKWRSGPPPSIGWWPASAAQNDGLYRWWNGVMWSMAVTEDDNLRAVARAARTPDRVTPQVRIQYRNRPSNWPERSRT